MQILLLCNLGVSTSLIVQRMQEIAPEGTVVVAAAQGTLEDIIGDYDVVLIGPQIRFREGRIRAVADSKGVAVGLIEPIWYGRCMVKEILELAFSLVENKGEK